MKRAGFTMIELIFVIVILGILAAVALPKFIGVSEQARAGKCDAFVGTLNRTVLPAIWAAALADGTVDTDAEVKGYFTEGNITAQIDVPAECGTAAEYATVAAGAVGTSDTISLSGVTYTYENNVTAALHNSPIISWHK